MVLNVPFEVTEEELTELLGGIGQRLNIAIDDVKLIRKPKPPGRPHLISRLVICPGELMAMRANRAKRSSAGRAFVELRTAADQAALLANVGDIMLGDRTLVLRPAQA